jgi:hypothetical protein
MLICLDVLCLLALLIVFFIIGAWVLNKDLSTKHYTIILNDTELKGKMVPKNCRLES